jgi:hypothetical protein
MAYPTPPLTSSPPFASKPTSSSHEPEAQSTSGYCPYVATAYKGPSSGVAGEYYQSSSTTARAPPQDSYYQSGGPPAHSSYNSNSGPPAHESYYEGASGPQASTTTFYTAPQVPSTGSKLPAQDSYYHSTSAPTSPLHTPLFAPPSSTQYPPSSTRPPRRRSSPIDPTAGQRISAQDSYWASISAPASPNSTAPYTRLSPRPLHFSPLNKPPTPFSASRPKPRPGFIQRMLQKIAGWIQAFTGWGRQNPKLAGLVTFVPIVGLTAVYKIFKGLGKVFGGGKDGAGGRSPLTGATKGLGGGGGWIKGVEEKMAGVGFGEFKGFGGTKSGPIDGVMKVVHMLMYVFPSLPFFLFFVLV